MSRVPGGVRIAAVLAEGPRGHRLAAALLDASPRVAQAASGACRLDARGWGRRGGEGALVDRIRRVAGEAGLARVRVGVADTGATAEMAARLARAGAVLVLPGRDRDFLAPLPIVRLPVSPDLRETLVALGFRRIGELADRAPAELEARFGAPGLRALRLARGEEEEPFLPVPTEDVPAVSVELDGPVTELEPLLFLLRRLLARVRADLTAEARCAERLELWLELEDGSRRTAPVVPARPTAREEPLFELCRAALERMVGSGGGEWGPRAGLGAAARGLSAPVRALALRVPVRAPGEARQRDLFAREPRDPLAVDGALSRLRGRLGEEAVAVPRPRPDHRPEGQNRWAPAPRRRERPPPRPPEPAGPGDPRSTAEPVHPQGAGAGGPETTLPPTLRLLPRPRPLRVRTVGGRPSEVWDGGRCHAVVAAEGPERLSGDWWRAPYGREYHRLLTEEGELLWVFRSAFRRRAAGANEGGGAEGSAEIGADGGADGIGRGVRDGADGGGWWLHGWWD